MSEETETYVVDRTGWRPGPWDAEPDKLLWEHAGFDCMIVRSLHGHLCGYVGVPENHPWYEKHQDEVDVQVHGGLTYGAHCQDVICHSKPQKTWWLGFDCCHMGDLSPGLRMIDEAVSGRVFRKGTYRDLEYVHAETEGLADQARAVI
jgi:hypothetical protein